MSPFVAEVEKSSNLILIVDREGIFAHELSEELVSSGTVVVVSKKQVTNPSVIHIPFHVNMPQIPQGKYSHMLFIFDGAEETRELLSPILKKAKQEEANCVIVAPRALYSQDLHAKIIQEDPQASMCLLGDIFGSSQISSVVSGLFEKARKQGSIQLANMGLDIVYPVSFSATVKALLQAGFGTEKGRILHAFESHPITMLSVAHAMQKVEPFLKIDFHSSEKISEGQETPEGVSLLPAGYHPLHELQEVFRQYIQTEIPTTKEQGKIAFSLPRISAGKPRISLKAGIVFVVLLLLLAPYIGIGVFGGIGLSLLESAKKQAELGAFNQAGQTSQAAGIFFSLAQQASNPATSELGLLKQDTFVYMIQANLQNGVFLSQAAQNISDAVVRVQLIQKKPSYTTVSDASYVTNDVKQAALAISGLQTGDGVLHAKELLSLKQAFSLVANIADSLPSLLGIQKAKTYAILFQNNTELRPGGGFIGSYATLTVDKGNFSNIKIHDVYDADGQLHGHIEPPYILRRYIPIQHWYLRDSNFDVDFQKDAQNAAFFLQAETGENVDGVIALDLSFVKEVIGQLGSIYVPEYSQNVTADNFFTLTESHAEKNFFPGSTQKKDFLRALFDSLQAKVLAKRQDIVSLVPVATQAITEKHILMSFADTSVQNVFTANNLSSSLWDPRQPQDGVADGYIGINEANIGVNKANAFIKREVNQAVTIADKGTVTGAVNITYTNTGASQWPGGDYKNYLRVILPKGSQLTAIAINGQEQNIISAITDPAVFEAKGFTPPLGIEVDKAEEGGKSIFGFVVTVPTGGKTSVQVTYSSPETVNTSSSAFGYSQLLFKQPGTDNYPYTFTINFPNTYKVVSPLSGERLQDSSITKTFPFAKDTQLEYMFGKK